MKISKVHKVLISAIAILLVVAPASYASLGIKEYIPDDEEAEILTFDYIVSYSLDDILFNTIQDYDIVELTEGYHLSELGKPMLPTQNIRIALPENMAVESVNIVEFDQIEIQGNYNIIHSQPPSKVSQEIEKIKVDRDAGIYDSSDLYPTDIVSIIRQSDLMGQSWIELQISPIQYNPFEQKLFLNTNIELEIVGNDGYICGDYLPKVFSEDKIVSYEKMVENMVVNPNQVQLRTENDYFTLNIPTGSYDYVIITQSSWVDDFQPLANWKTKKGVKTEIVTLNEIYNNFGYSGSNQDKIQDFFQEAHSDWGTTFFLLGGDTNIVPHEEIHYYLEFSDGWEHIYAPADTYYADYDRDFTVEVNVGRAVARTDSDVATFIDKVLTYEITPPTTNYAKKASMFGFDLDSWTDGEDVKDIIDDDYIPSSWSMSNVYDSHSGDHETNVKNYVNAGQHLINHIDHCSASSMGVGSVNHGDYLSKTEVSNFNNGDHQSILYTTGCWPAAFDYTACIAESWVRDDNGGCVAFVGNSRYGVYNPGNLNSLSNKFDRYFFRSIFEQGHYILGEAFSDHKNDVGVSSDHYKFIFDELNLLGDPELPLWMDNPISLDVTHSSEIPIGGGLVTVHVEEVGGGAVQGAKICLWKGDEIYETTYTNSIGDAALFVTPISVGSIYLTVTNYHYNLPFESTVTAVSAPGQPYIPSNPEPEDGSIILELETNLLWTGGDPEDDTVTYDVYFGTTNPPPLYASDISVTFYDLPTLDYGTNYYWYIVAEDDAGSYPQPGPIWTFKTVDEDYMIVQGPVTSAGAEDITIEIYGKWTTPIGGYGIHLSYNPDILTVDWVDFAGSIGESAAPPNGFTIYDFPAGPGNLTIGAIWIPNTAGPGPGEDLLCTIYGDISASASNGESQLKLIEAWPDPIDGPSKTKFTDQSGSGYCPERIDGAIKIANQQCGDVNGNGEVDIDDVVYLISYIFTGGPAPVPEECMGNANGMGEVDIDDVVYLISYIFGGGPPPVENCCS